MEWWLWLLVVWFGLKIESIDITGRDTTIEKSFSIIIMRGFGNDVAPGDGMNKKNDCYYFVEMYIDRGRTIKFRSELDFHCWMQDDEERACKRDEESHVEGWLFYQQ